MELISKKIQKTTDFCLVGSFGFFVLIPLLFSLYRYLIDLDFQFLSPLFFWVLLKATGFALLQSILSVAATAAFAYFTVAYFKEKNTSSNAKKFLELSGFLAFSLSPTLVALCLTLSLSSLFNLNPSGILAIIFCHFLMNGAYFASQFYKRAERYYAAEASLHSEYLKTLGASPKQERRLLLWPLFKNDLRSWGPQVFLWCFMSFAPIVLLSSGTGQNTPELLLYYSLLNDPSGSRVLIIFLLTALISFFLTRFAYFKPKVKSPETFSITQDKPTLLSTNSTLIVISLLLLFPFLYTLLSPLFLGGKLSSELLNCLLATGLIFLLSFFFSLFFGIMSLLSSQELKIISFCNFISAPMVLTGFLSLDLPQSQSYLWISLGSFLALLPWAHRRLRSQLEALPLEQRDLALTLGMKNFSYFRYYLWPELGPSVLKISLLFSLWSLGEYTFSKAYLNQSSTLALFIEENLRRYNFAEASTALSLTLLASVIVVTPLLWKARKNAPL